MEAADEPASVVGCEAEVVGCVPCVDDSTDTTVLDARVSVVLEITTVAVVDARVAVVVVC